MLSNIIFKKNTIELEPHNSSGKELWIHSNPQFENNLFYTDDIFQFGFSKLFTGNFTSLHLLHNGFFQNFSLAVKDDHGYLVKKFYNIESTIVTIDDSILPSRFITIDNVQLNDTSEDYILGWFDNVFDNEIDYSECEKAYLGFSTINIFDELNKQNNYENNIEDVANFIFESSQEEISKEDMVRFINQKVLLIGIVELENFTADENLYYFRQIDDSGNLIEDETHIHKIAVPDDITRQDETYNHIKIAKFNMSLFNNSSKLYPYIWTNKISFTSNIIKED